MKSSFFARASAWLSCAAIVASFAAPASAQDSSTAERPTTVAATQNPFVDVSPNNWAYQAIIQLHNDGLLNGYPDGYFKGKRSLTRYEIAVLTQRVVDKIEADLSDTSKATKVNSDDIALARKLLDEYGTELSSIKHELDAVKVESDANAAQLRRATLHVQYYGRPGIYGERSTIVDGYGNEVSNGTKGLYGTAFATQNSPLTNADLRQDGSVRHGTGYQILRVGLSGDLGNNVSYETRLSNDLYFDTVNSSSTNGLTLDFADIKWQGPNGWNLTAGRFPAKNSSIGLLYDDYFNGARVGYVKNRFSGDLGYSFNAAAQSNTVGSVLAGGTGSGQASQTVFLHGNYTFSKKIDGGVTYVSDIFPTNGASAFAYDPVTGIAVEHAVGAKPQSGVSVNANVQVNSKLALQGELARHTGKDPITGDKYVQPSAFWGKAFYGNTKPSVNHNFAEAGYIVAGVNGLSPHSSTFGLGDDYQQFYAGSLDGYHLVYLGAHHYLSDNTRIGLVYQRFALNPGVELPQALNLSGNDTTFLSHDQGQALFLETTFAF